MSLLNTFAKATSRSCKYFVSITDATNTRYELVEVNVVHDGSDAYVNSFGSVTNYTGPTAQFTADISGSNVRLFATNITADSMVFKFQRIAVDV